MRTAKLAGAPLDFAALRSELAVPGEFSTAVLTEARAAAESVPLPTDDATDIPLVTVDPPGSQDLDQALHLARDGDGYLVSYAIADVAAFVRPDGAIDAEANRRGQTLYFPDARVPLHPTLLSEGAASLLPDQVRPAVLWQIRLSADGTVEDVAVRHARVRSRAKLDYAGLQEALTDGTAPEAARLFPEVGALRLAQARSRRAINLEIPDQEVVRSGDSWTLAIRSELPVERWNAELSLLTGMCAAQLMVEHGVGILRTLPEPDEKVIGWLHRVAPALDVTWPKGVPAGEIVAGLDRTNPRHLAFCDHAMSLLRGAGYQLVGSKPADQLHHAGVGGLYAHVTAPLRRLVDRYASTLCVELAAGRPAPDWIVAALPGLPAAMATSDQRSGEADRAVLDATEAWLLVDRVGQTFSAVVLDTEDERAKIALDDPPVRASAHGEFTAGERTKVKLVAADVAARLVRFDAA